MKKKKDRLLIEGIADIEIKRKKVGRNLNREEEEREGGPVSSSKELLQTAN